MGLRRTLGLLSLVVAIAGCAMAQRVAALRNVDFSLDRVAALRLAGVDMDGVTSLDQLSGAQTARILTAVLSRNVPLSFDLFVRAANPTSNASAAELIGLDWTLLLKGHDTISGVFNRRVPIIDPGAEVVFPMHMELNLVDFFDRNAADLIDLVGALSGNGGEPVDVALRAVPVLNTPFGPLRFPAPITIVHERIGGSPTT